jgi:hypothetical protein
MSYLFSEWNRTLLNYRNADAKQTFCESARSISQLLPFLLHNWGVNKDGIFIVFSPYGNVRAVLVS